VLRTLATVLIMVFLDACGRRRPSAEPSARHTHVDAFREEADSSATQARPFVDASVGPNRSGSSAGGERAECILDPRYRVHLILHNDSDYPVWTSRANRPNMTHISGRASVCSPSGRVCVIPGSAFLDENQKYVPFWGFPRTNLHPSYERWPLPLHPGIDSHIIPPHTDTEWVMMDATFRHDSFEECAVGFFRNDVAVSQVTDQGLIDRYEVVLRTPMIRSVHRGCRAVSERMLR
jgi:hypothetical protein